MDWANMAYSTKKIFMNTKGIKNQYLHENRKGKQQKIKPEL